VERGRAAVARRARRRRPRPARRAALPDPRRPGGRARDHRHLRGPARHLGLRAQRAHPDDPHYLYKLDWLAALRASVTDPATAIVAGDMNIAPTDDDVWDPALFVASTHVTPAERKALAELTALGLRDVVRDRWPDSRVFTYWDYRAGRFHQDLGMRIDLVLAGADPAGRAKAVWIDRKARKGKAPSDHAPVIVDLDTAPDGDLGPVVPPPSRRPCGAADHRAVSATARRAPRSPRCSRRSRLRRRRRPSCRHRG
jgi:hypothetical protein